MGSRTNFGSSRAARRTALLAATALTLTLIYTGPGMAAPDACGAGYICSGDQSAGINLTAPPNSLTIQGLTTQIAPDPGVAGVLFTGVGTVPAGFGAAGGAAPALTLNSDLGTLGLTVTGNSGIVVVSQGANGAFADFGNNPGGSGGNGGAVTLTNSGPVVVNGGYGIVAQSFAGAGGNGGTNFGPEPGGAGGAGGNAGPVTLTNHGTVTVSGPDSRGIFVESFGGDGGPGGPSVGLVGGPDGAPGLSGAGGNIVIDNTSAITTNGANSIGIFAHSAGGLSGAAGTISITSSGAIETHGDGAFGVASTDVGSTPFNGERGSDITLTNSISGGITTNDINAHGVWVASVGGRGADGSDDDGVFSATGDPGATGGNGGNVILVHSGNVLTKGADAAGILAQTKGGAGGNGGDASAADATGGSGGGGGNAGIVTATNNGRIETLGDRSYGVIVQSLGGNGGSGGSGDGVSGEGGGGAGSGLAGTATLINKGTVITHGVLAYGLFAQSIGGFSGGGGGGSGIVGYGGDGSQGGAGGDAFITNDTGASVITHGESAHALFVQSVGGGGGDGGSGSGIAGLGTSGEAGGAGGTVGATNKGSLETTGESARGIFAQSVGGGGGNGGSGSGLVGLGGSGSGTSPGGTVTVDNSGSITTVGKQGQAIFAESVGGGGGDGGTGSGLVTFGGSGGGGGNGLAVTVTNSGILKTSGTESTGIFAQSVGGGGGNGGNAYSGSSNVAFAFGGSGGAGGTGGPVTVTSTAGSITTSGDRARGIQAQSVGGGGGNGGAAVAVSAGSAFNASFAFGGSGGDGGISLPVAIISGGTVETHGADAHGLFAQSVGGGGGSGGMSIAAAPASAVAASLSMGGSGGLGGNSSTVTISSPGAVTTTGFHSYGILAQSVGGGGGAGGISAAGAGGIGSLTAALGGSGGGGGTGGGVNLTSNGFVSTTGEMSHAIFAQSVGGGGGAGGYSVSVNASVLAGVGFSMGGTGGSGGNADKVTVTSTAGAKTTKDDSHGIVAQSVGGGGGSGGFAISGSLSAGYAGAIGIGGSGAVGGIGGDVTVASSDTITTEGFHSYGILAQSTGGGGGDGGFSIAGSIAGDAAASFAIGGSGAGGGSAGKVAVTSSSTITTSGNVAYGILAQSVGGGGGTGGFAMAGSLSAGSFGPVSSMAFSLGGSGGTGGTGGVVTLTSTGKISTTGDGSHALFAQSIGGGGGAGGYSGSFTGSFGPGASVSLALGGKGGAGGAAGAVTVHSTDKLSTQGLGADGILAQSVGGGGGNAGWALAVGFGGLGAPGAASVAIGGSGGSGGDGGVVTVDNDGGITTKGRKAHGIFAQSVGGGGGDGGWAGSGTLTLNPSSSTALSVAVGGTGGSGGNGFAVSVDNDGDIETHGDEAFGIFAQSVGGGGGDGGLAISATFSGPGAKQFSLALGGNGGTGGNGGAVNVINDGTISTTNLRGRGIFAQSVGGGGGTGGLAVATTFDINTPRNAAASIAIAIGGKGGSGGIGGTVTVDNNNGITTGEDDGTAIFAQSIGGGGGSGGAAYAGSAAIVPPGFSTNLAIDVAVGGNGGNGNNGGAVGIDNSGTLATSGDNAHGIFAQSVGGGGGSGGSTRTMNILLGVPVLSRTEDNLTVALSVGGNGGGSSDGGVVNVVNSGDIETHGADSFGIFAQSIGGGGGSGGEAAHGFYGVPVFGINRVDFFKDLTITIGGQAGSSGSGKAVTVLNSGKIITHGDGSEGIFAQSVGGGGGTGGGSNAGLLGKIAVSGQGGSAGDGGAIGVTNHGDIETFGIIAHGIEAQSVGGGGGKGGTPNRGFLNFGILPTFGLGGGSAGNGGDVTIINTANITTHGDGAIAILAQSVGGGGGSAGDIGNGLGYMGSAGGAGNAGAISINHAGAIATAGENAHGIVAQSTSADAAGNVSVTLRGSITATGTNADGIVAQSLGGDSNGAITIVLQTDRGGSGSVSGGTGSATAVRFLDGTDANALTSHGSLTTSTGLAGFTVIGSAHTETIDNFGTFTGGASLGGGANVFNNHGGGTLAIGTSFDLGGTGNVLTNEGTLSPGGAGNVFTAAANGRLVQTAAANYAVDVDFATSTADRLNLTGTADMAGNVAINPLNKKKFAPGTRQMTILSAAGGLSSNALTLSAPASAVISYSLAHPNANDETLSYTVDLTPAGVDLSGNQGSVADYVGRILAAGGTPAFDPIAEHIFDLPDGNALSDYYRSLVSEPLLAPAVSTMFAGESLNNAMLSCRVQDGDSFRFLDEGECNWFQVSPRRVKRESVTPGLDSDENLTTVSAGGQAIVADNLRVGIGAAYQNSQLEVGKALTSNGQRGMAGVALKFVTDPMLAALTVTGGFGTTDSTRSVGGSIATSRQNSKFAAGQFRVAAQWATQNLYVRPMVDVAGGIAWLQGFKEKGAGPLDLIVGDTRYTYASVTPALEVGGELGIYRDAVMRPFARVGLTQYLTGDHQEIAASFAGAPAGISPFVNQAKLDSQVMTVDVGVDLLNAGRAAARIDYTLQLGEHTRAQGLTLKLSTAW